MKMLIADIIRILVTSALAVWITVRLCGWFGYLVAIQPIGMLVIAGASAIKKRLQDAQDVDHYQETV